MNSTIEILDEITHREVKLDFNAARSAARKERLLPVVVSEFHALMFHYPIVFVKDRDTGEFTCSVLLGVNADANLLDGKDIADDESLPLNIRRLPLLAIAPPADDSEGRPLIAINMASPGVGQGELFLKNKPLAFDSAIAALSELYEGYKETREYVNNIVALDLISKLNAEIRYPDKPSLTLEGLYGIDVNKIAQLVERDNDTKNRFLAVASYAYAQHFSLYNLKKLAPLIS